MAEIIEYTKQYREHVNQMMYDIMVEEYGFADFGKEILMATNEEYLTGNNKLWLAKENEVIVGTMGILKINEERALLKKVYVKREHRGSGISQQLLDLCLEYALQQNYQFIHLGTYHRLERAKNFYLKNGFEMYESEYGNTQGDEISFCLNLNNYMRNLRNVMETIE